MFGNLSYAGLREQKSKDSCESLARDNTKAGASAQAGGWGWDGAAEQAVGLPLPFLALAMRGWWGPAPVPPGT